MIYGEFRRRFPRVVLSLPGWNGPLEIEFVVDTAFDGDLAVPPNVARLLEAEPSGRRGQSLAGGSLFTSAACEMMLDWNGESRLMEGLHLGADMEPGGEVSLEPL